MTSYPSFEWLSGKIAERCEEFAVWVSRDGSCYAAAAIKKPTNVMLGEACGDFEANGRSPEEALYNLMVEINAEAWR